MPWEISRTWSNTPVTPLGGITGISHPPNAASGTQHHRQRPASRMPSAIPAVPGGIAASPQDNGALAVMTDPDGRAMLVESCTASRPEADMGFEAS